ncbi:O-antigen ligase family protein [Reinekea forsetii]|uniref:O-antigen ligase-like membrane protein n=1 Tax=Reinekea forsetii TaxID=1336806 RepID=A0A2K8KRW6_9GAMM|nr:O-antigen ligase family protein [Reinekea forsetii]ATX76611.1 O-antigen ligase-like membrane protein [Reinekea forsetii]
MRLIHGKWQHTFLNLHLVTLSWSAVARFNDWTPLPLLFLCLAVFSIVIRILLDVGFARPVSVRTSKVDCLIVVAFFLMCLNVLYNPTAKGGNYLLAYGVVFGMYLCCLAMGLRNISTNELLKYNYYGVNFICLFVILEVLGRSALGFDVFEWIPRSKEATATVAVGFFRGYGFSTEPTQVGNYFACFVPYAIFYRSNIARKGSRIYSIFLVLAATMTFSAALALVAFCGVLIYFVFTNKKLSMIKSLLFLGIILVILFSLSIYTMGIGDILYEAYDKVSSKLLLTSDGTSVGQRMIALETGIATIQNYPLFGIGLGYLSSLGQDSSINWYIFLGSEAGLIILGFFVFWFAFHLINAVLNYSRTRKEIFLWAAVSIFCGMAYLMFISTFQNMFLLTSILLYRVIQKNLTFSQGR